MKAPKIIKVIIANLVILTSLNTFCQTFFESAEGDGVIAFRNNTISQIKLNFNSTSITYGYYFVGLKAIDPKGFLLNFEVKASPNNNGIATLAKSGKLQPGLGINSSLGYRWKRVFPNNWSILDVYIKPQFFYKAYSIYDTLRKQTDEELLYEVNKSSFSLNATINFGIAINRFNIFLGAQLGRNSTLNADDFDNVTIQTILPAFGSTTSYVFSDIEDAKMGHLERVNKTPFAADLIIDSGIELGQGSGSNTKLGGFGYLRSDGKDNKYRTGFGICLLAQQNPSRVFTSFGYELPMYGKGVKKENNKNDKGIVFVSVGFSIF